MKYLILGANGLIGKAAVRICRTQGIACTGTSYSRGNDELEVFDLLDFEAMPDFFDRISPNVIFNATGLAGGVNFCEQNPSTGRLYHVDATRVMVEWCANNNCAFAFISTDYVFDGTQPSYKEDDKTNPLNAYGTYKLEAERIIEEHLKKYVIARTTNVFGWDPETVTPNFLMHVVQTLEKQDTIKVPSFLYGTPTLVDGLAAGMIDLLNNRRYGLYHIVGSGYINRYEWAKKLLEMAGMSDKGIEEIKTPPPDMVPRPLLSHLDNAKFCAASNVKMHRIEDGLQVFIEKMRA